MRKIILITISLSIFLFNCSNPKEENKLEKYNPSDYFNSMKEKQIISGIGIGLLKIEESRYKDIFDEKYTPAFYLKNGIDLHFREGDTLIGIILQNDGNYSVESNIKIGMTEKEIIKSLGAPTNRNIQLNKANVTLGEMKSLNYSGMSIIFIDSTTSVISIFKRGL